jgi:hypothetical protein
VLGAVRAVAAGGRIRGSEGTLAGPALANWGWWLSIITGLGFAAFYGATVLAVTQQADNFLRVEGPDSGFLPLLQKGKFDQAFLLTQPPSRRATVNLDDPRALELLDIPISKSPKGLLSLFRSNDIVLMLREAGETAQIKPLGVKEWVHGKTGFTVKRTYRISTPEAEIDVVLPVLSSEGDESGPGRKWFVQFFPPPKFTLQPTRLGEVMTGYRYQARSFIRSWVEKINLNDPSARGVTYLDTLEPAARDKARRIGAIRTGMRLILQTLEHSGLAPGCGLTISGTGPQFRWEDYDPWLYLPGYAEFVTGKGVDHTDWEKTCKDADVRNKIRAQVRDSFFGRNYPGRPQVVIKAPEESYLPYRKKDGKIQIISSYDMPVGMTAQEPVAKFVAELVVTAEAREVDSPQEVGTISLSDWRIVGIDVPRLFNLPQGPMRIEIPQPPPPPR